MPAGLYCTVPGEVSIVPGRSLGWPRYPTSCSEGVEDDGRMKGVPSEPDGGKIRAGLRKDCSDCSGALVFLASNFFDNAKKTI